MMIKKLPQVYQQNQLMTQMSKFFEDKKIIFCSSVYHENGKCHIIKKPSGKPVFDIDRPLYSMIRGTAKTLITSENVLKGEKDTFKTHFSRGDKDIQKMYDTLRDKQKQNVFVMSDMKKEDLLPYINSDHYNLIGEQSLKKHEGGKITLRQVLTDLCDKKMTPILIECGPTIMNEFWKDCKSNKEKNLLETVYFACFEGKMKKQCIGDSYEFDDSCYKKVWESDKFDVKDDMDNTGKLFFKVYELKKDY